LVRKGVTMSQALWETFDSGDSNGLGHSERKDGDSVEQFELLARRDLLVTPGGVLNPFCESSRSELDSPDLCDLAERGAADECGRSGEGHGLECTPSEITCSSPAVSVVPLSTGSGVSGDHNNDHEACCTSYLTRVPGGPRCEASNGAARRLIIRTAGILSRSPVCAAVAAASLLTVCGAAASTYYAATAVSTVSSESVDPGVTSSYAGAGSGGTGSWAEEDFPSEASAPPCGAEVTVPWWSNHH